MYLESLGKLWLKGTPLARPKPLLMLAYLCLEGPQLRRDLAMMFFPNSDDRSDALSTTLRRLRKAGDAIFEDSGRISASVTCDAIVLIEHCKNGDLEAALALYGGAFAAGLGEDLGLELEEWVFHTRERLAGLVRNAQLELSERAAAAGETSRSLAHAEDALKLDTPLSSRDLNRLHVLLTPHGGTALEHLKREATAVGETLLEIAQVPNNLPAFNTAFIGRERQLAELSDLLKRTDNRLVTLHGSGGIGKTRLALEVAWRLYGMSGFADGVFFVPLDGLEHPGSVAAQIGERLNITLSPTMDSFAALALGIGARETLLVLDNFEHLIEAGAHLPRLLSKCPNLALLVTSRERLNLKGETVVTLGGLELPVLGEFQQPSEALRLLEERARRARADFALTSAILPDAARICALLSGFPLALELAASRLRYESIPELRRSLERDVLSLESSFRDVHARHRGIRAVFDHSWNLLSPTRRNELAQLTIFHDGFTRDAALAVSGADARAIGMLVDRSLIVMESDGRLNFHTLQHSYFRAMLKAQPELEREARIAHALYFAGQIAALNHASTAEIIDFMQVEQRNLRAALRFLLPRQKFDDFVAIANPHLWHAALIGRLESNVRQLPEILEALVPTVEHVALTQRVDFSSSRN